MQERGMDRTGLLRFCRDVHENCAEFEEISRAQRLGEEVGVVVGSVNVGHGELAVFDKLANPKVAPVDVLCAIVMLGIVCKIACGFVVCGLCGGAGGGETELGDEVAYGDGVFRSGGSGDNLSFAAGEGDNGLAFRAPGDGGTSPHDGPAGRGLAQGQVGI